MLQGLKCHKLLLPTACPNPLIAKGSSCILLAIINYGVLQLWTPLQLQETPPKGLHLPPIPIADSSNGEGPSILSRPSPPPEAPNPHSSSTEEEVPSLESPRTLQGELERENSGHGLLFSKHERADEVFSSLQDFL